MKLSTLLKASVIVLGISGFTQLTGCATHAQISMPAVEQVNDQKFENKTFTYNILYSQPKPGVFTGGEQQALKPLAEQELSVGSANVLQKFAFYLEQQLPKSSKVVSESKSDYHLTIKMIAKHKKGPVYSDFEAGKSFAKSLFTFGLASSEYNIVANFDVNYELMKGDILVYTKEFNVKDSADHQRGKLDGFADLNEYSGQMFEKHIILTLNRFFKEASNKL